MTTPLHDIFSGVVAQRLGWALVHFLWQGLALALLRPQHFPMSADWIRQQYHWSAIRHGLTTSD
jgi:hypothetical protein